MAIRVAVIGAGIMGADHARIMANDVPEARLAVVCDVDTDAARRVAETCGADDVSSDPEAVVARNDVDAVLIASPDPTHAPLTLAALRRGKPVLCEKPLAPDSGACLDIVAAETEIGRRLVQVGFMRRFDPSYVEMKSALGSGAIGAAVMMHNFHRNVASPPGFTGLMAITNSAPHEFDAARYVLDSEIIAVTAFEPAADTGSDCKPVVMVLETAAGQIVTVEVNNNATYGYDVRAELVGREGAVSFGERPALRHDRGLSSASPYAADWRPRFAEAYRQQNKAWIRSIATGRPSEIASNAWDGYCAAAVAEAGAKALASGQRTEVNLERRPALYAAEETAE